MMTKTSLRLELFITDMAVSRFFYERILGFVADDGAHANYVPLRLGDVTLSLNLMAELDSAHPIHAMPEDRRGLGVEIVLDMPDIDALADSVREHGWPLASDVELRPWGARDFRVKDPDGYYLRFSAALPDNLKIGIPIARRT
jgi:lactoylglutathione lyase